MMIYLDASVVFSLHFRDANTPAALTLIGTADAPLAISSLCEVETVNAFKPGDGGRGRTKYTDVLEWRGSKPAAKNIGPSEGLSQRFALDDEVGQHAGWGIMHPAAILQFFGDESGVIVSGGALDGIVLRVIGLDEDATWEFSPAGAA